MYYNPVEIDIIIFFWEGGGRGLFKLKMMEN